MDTPFLRRSLVILTLVVLVLPVLIVFYVSGRHCFGANNRNSRVARRPRCQRQSQIAVPAQTHRR